MIGLIAVTAAGRTHASQLAAAWPGETHTYATSASEALARAWTECDAVVCMLSTGATIRLLAPLLSDKHTDPAVVCVDEAATYAIALLGGHHGRAGITGNDLAASIATVLDADPIVTTGSEVTGIPGLDTLGWPVDGAVAAVGRAVLDGAPVRLEAAATWPLPALPPHVDVDPAPGARAQSEPTEHTKDTEHAQYRILVSDRAYVGDAHTVLLRPPSLVVGVGASRGVAATEILELIDDALTEAGLATGAVGGMASVDAKADEAGVIAAADARGWPLRTHPAETLADIAVPHPSRAALQAVGTPSVAEAAALAEAGAGAELVVAKRKKAMATVAIARRRPRGRLAIVGLGPGARDLLPPRAVAEIRRAGVVVGLDQYLDQVRDLLRPGTRVLSSGLGEEEQRAHTAVEQARAGHAVALVGSGDAGIYAMASPALERAGADIDVVGVPGITAALAAGTVLGAPLGHDHALVSLSDLHTPWAAIERRVRAVAESDLAVVFYNPRSSERQWQLGRALEILAACRPPTTPVGVVREATRTEEQVTLTTLADVNPAIVDMLSVVVVGTSQTRTVAGRMVTPRGYAWQPS